MRNSQFKSWNWDNFIKNKLKYLVNSMQDDKIKKNKNCNDKSKKKNLSISLFIAYSET